MLVIKWDEEKRFWYKISDTPQGLCANYVPLFRPFFTTSSSRYRHVEFDPLPRPLPP